VFERAKIFRALDRAATAIGPLTINAIKNIRILIKVETEMPRFSGNASFLLTKLPYGQKVQNVENLSEQFL
jgi:hypothetical protein